MIGLIQPMLMRVMILIRLQLLLEQIMNFKLMRTNREIKIAKLFNNPLGRKYLGVPKGKEIFKITKSSTHYYTGELSKRNGMPIICTGAHSPGGKSNIRFIHWLETWKPIHLCWLYIRMGWKIPKYLIGLDSGLKLPTVTDSSNRWNNPDNSLTEDDNYSVSWSSGDAYVYYSTFGFGIGASDTIDGIIVSANGQGFVEGSPDTAKYNYRHYGDAKNSGIKGIWNTSVRGTVTDGSSVDIWDTWIGGSPTGADFSDANYSLRVSLSSSDEVVNLYWVKVQVYYTEATGTNFKVNISDTFKDVSAMKINISDSWKDVSAGQVNIGDAWKDIF